MALRPAGNRSPVTSRREALVVALYLKIVDFLRVQSTIGRANADGGVAVT